MSTRAATGRPNGRGRRRLRMPFGRRVAAALTAAVLIAAPARGGAGGPSDASARPDRPSAPGLAPAPAGKLLTGKERLSSKASDDQRLDNCKVPLEKRGPKPRPESCDHVEDGAR